MAAKFKTTREAIFKDIWGTNLSKTSEKYDISMNELLKVCEEKNIPLPYDSYYADKSAGRPVHIPELPSADDETVELQCVWKRRKKIDAMLGSKANAICILQTLEDYSDANKALSVADIIRLMEENYQLTIDRKTIYSTIELLTVLGYDIITDKIGSKNYYALLDKTLDPHEVKIIMDSLMLNPLLPPKTSDEISNKVNKYLAKRTSLQNTWHWHTFDKYIEKYDTDIGLYNILDEIDAALMQGKKLEFNYIKYDTNGNKVLYNDKKYLVSPYMINIHNFTYYLFCRVDTDDKCVEFRLDRMTNVRMLDEDTDGKRVAGVGRRIGSYNPDKRTPLYVTMKCDNELLEKITDDFADHLQTVHFNDNNDGKTFNVTIVANMTNITNWAAGVTDKCEVIEPQDVRDEVINIIKNNKYGV